MSERLLPKSFFLALAAVLWADDRLQVVEADAIATIAADHGFTKAQMEEIDQWIGDPIDLNTLDLSGLSAVEKPYLYALAVWIASLSSGVHKSEQETLDQLARKLALQEHQANNLQATVRDLHARDGVELTRVGVGRLQRALGYER